MKQNIYFLSQLEYLSEINPLAERLIPSKGGLPVKFIGQVSPPSIEKKSSLHIYTKLQESIDVFPKYEWIEYLSSGGTTFFSHKSSTRSNEYDAIERALITHLETRKEVYFPSQDFFNHIFKEIPYTSNLMSLRNKDSSFGRARITYVPHTQKKGKLEIDLIFLKLRFIQ